MSMGRLEKVGQGGHLEANNSKSKKNETLLETFS